MGKPSKGMDFNPSRIVREVDVPRWDRETDVVVVGLGSAGACAAIEARRAGAEVLVLERVGSGGGTSAMAGGQVYMGGGTPLQEHCGFEDDPDEMFKYLVASCGPDAPEDKIRVYCDESVAHYHWLHRSRRALQDELPGPRGHHRPPHRRRPHVDGQRARPPLQRDREARAARTHGCSSRARTRASC